MKKIIIVLFLSPLITLAQNDWFKADYLCARKKIDEKNWTPCDWTETNVLIYVDLENEKKFIIQTNEEQVYNIVDFYNPTESSMQTTFTFRCVDKFGIRSTILMIFDKKEKRVVFSVYSGNLSWSYSAKYTETE